ncbi:uncharacterized protein AMSG_12238 [Thecamonas trahens ATCC 50062]|uniref:FERM domain-containing protein n=1 Tax=Thecamonas trahens ATCC 50062 TaxID=461836 RepID=A0A0L0DLQ1_THETB|nr:hypothetical protein AMSG_12238 [Thecamonas trahens ATCC 50062]KNC52971.1 hypothetical protein AMSG_12238 [Thecamonas trahens ATCC 50062]|eukprot:XP_013754916.1 hypothetical protein AMSG_12238 [Thecamonas trahens ATCC 50062]
MGASASRLTKAAGEVAAVAESRAGEARAAARAAESAARAAKDAAAIAAQNAAGKDAEDDLDRPSREATDDAALLANMAALEVEAYVDTSVNAHRHTPEAVAKRQAEAAKGGRPLPQSRQASPSPGELWGGVRGNAVTPGFLNENQLRALLSEDLAAADIDALATSYRLNADSLAAVIKHHALYEPIPDEDGTLRGYWVVPPLSPKQQLLLDEDALTNIMAPQARAVDDGDVVMVVRTAGGVGRAVRSSQVLTSSSLAHDSGDAAAAQRKEAARNEENGDVMLDDAVVTGPALPKPRSTLGRHVTESLMTLTIEVFDRHPVTGVEALFISRKLQEVDPLWTVNQLADVINESILHSDPTKTPEQGWADDGLGRAENVAKHLDIDFVAKYLQGPRTLKFYSIKTRSRLHYKMRRRAVKFHIFGSLRTVLIDESWRVYRIVKEIGSVLGLRAPDEYSLKVEDDPHHPEKHWLRGAQTLPEQRIPLDVTWDSAGEEVPPPVLHFKKKLFFKHTPNFDPTNPEAMFIYYQQCTAMVLSCELYTSRTEAVLFAALQLLIRDSGYNPQLHDLPGFVKRWSDCCPAHVIPSKAKAKSRLEDAVRSTMHRFKAYSREQLIVKYVKLCRASKFFGWANWPIKEQVRSGRKYRFVARVLSISGKGVRLLDPAKHNDVVVSHPWTEVVAVGGITINRGFGLMFDFSRGNALRIQVQMEDQTALTEASQYVADYMRMMVLLERNKKKRLAQARDDVWGPLAVGFQMPPAHQRSGRIPACSAGAKSVVASMQLAMLDDEAPASAGGAIVPDIPKQNVPIVDHETDETAAVGAVSTVASTLNKSAAASRDLHTTVIMDDDDIATKTTHDKSWDVIALDSDDDNEISKLLAQADAQDNVAVLSASLAVSTNELLHASALDDPLMIDPSALLAAAQGLADMLASLTEATATAAGVAASPETAHALAEAHKSVQSSTAGLVAAATDVAAAAVDHHAKLATCKSDDPKEDLMALYEITDSDSGSDSDSNDSEDGTQEGNATAAGASDGLRSREAKLKAATAIDISSLMAAASQVGSSVSGLLATSGVATSTERQVERLGRMAEAVTEAALDLTDACINFFPDELPLTEAAILERRLCSLGRLVPDVHNSLLVKGAQLLEMMRIATGAIPAHYAAKFELGLTAYEAMATLYTTLEHINDRPDFHDDYARVLQELRYHLNLLKDRTVAQDATRLDMYVTYIGELATELGTIIETEAEACDVNGSWAALEAEAGDFARAVLALQDIAASVGENPDTSGIARLKTETCDVLDALDSIHVSRAHLFVIEDVLDASALVLGHMRSVLDAATDLPLLASDDGERMLFEANRAIDRLSTTMRIYSVNPSNVRHQDIAMQAARKAVRKFGALLDGILVPLGAAIAEGSKLSASDDGALLAAEVAHGSLAQLKEALSVAAIDCWPLDVNSAIQVIHNEIQAINAALDKVADPSVGLNPAPGDHHSEFEWQAELLRSVRSIPKEVTDIRDTAMTLTPAEFALDCKDVAAEVTILAEASIGMASYSTTRQAQYSLLTAARAFCTDAIELIECAQTVVREGNDPYGSETAVAAALALVLSALDELMLCIPGIGDTRRLVRKLEGEATEVSSQIRLASQPKVAQFGDLASAASDLASALAALADIPAAAPSPLTGLQASTSSSGRRGSIMATSGLAALAGESSTSVQKADTSPLAMMEQEVSAAGRTLAALVSSLDRAALASPSALAHAVSRVSAMADVIYRAAAASVATPELADSAQSINAPLLSLLQSTLVALRDAADIAVDPTDDEARARFRQNDVAGSIATLHMTYKELAAPNPEAQSKELDKARTMIDGALAKLASYKDDCSGGNELASVDDSEQDVPVAQAALELQDRVLASTAELQTASQALANVAEVSPDDYASAVSRVGLLTTKTINCVLATAQHLKSSVAAKAAASAAKHAVIFGAKVVEKDVALVAQALSGLSGVDPHKGALLTRETQHLTAATHDLLIHNKRVLRKLPLQDKAKRQRVQRWGASLKAAERAVRRASKVLRLSPDSDRANEALNVRVAEFSAALADYVEYMGVLELAEYDHAAAVVANIKDALIDETIEVANLQTSLLVTSQLVVANPTHAAAHRNMTAALGESVRALQSLHETAALVSPGQKECVFAIDHVEKCAQHMQRFLAQFARDALPPSTTSNYGKCLDRLLAHLNVLEAAASELATQATSSAEGLGAAALHFAELADPLRVLSLDAAVTCGSAELGLRILREARDIPLQAVPFVKACQTCRGGAVPADVADEATPAALLHLFQVEIHELREVLEADRAERHSLATLRALVEASNAKLAAAATTRHDGERPRGPRLTYGKYVARIKAAFADFLVVIKKLVTMANAHAKRDAVLEDEELAVFGVHAAALGKVFPPIVDEVAGCIAVTSDKKLQDVLAQAGADVGTQLLAFVDELMALQARDVEASAVVSASSGVSIALARLLQTVGRGETPKRVFESACSEMAAATSSLRTATYILNAVDQDEVGEAESLESGDRGGADEQPATFGECMVEVAARLRESRGQVATALAANKIDDESAAVVAREVARRHEATMATLSFSLLLLTSVAERNRVAEVGTDAAKALEMALQLLGSKNHAAGASKALAAVDKALGAVEKAADECGHAEAQARDEVVAMAAEVAAIRSDAVKLASGYASGSSQVYLVQVVDALKFGRHLVQKLLYESEALVCKPLKLVGEVRRVVRNYAETVTTLGEAQCWLASDEHATAVADALTVLGGAVEGVVGKVFDGDEVRSRMATAHATSATLAMRALTTTQYGPVRLAADEAIAAAAAVSKRASMAGGESGLAGGDSDAVFAAELQALVDEMEKGKVVLAKIHLAGDGGTEVDVERENFKSIALRCCGEMADACVTLARVVVIALEETMPSDEEREELLIALYAVSAAVTQMTTAMVLFSEGAPAKALSRAVSVVSEAVMSLVADALRERTQSAAAGSVRKAASMVGSACATLLQAVEVYTTPASKMVREDVSNASGGASGGLALAGATSAEAANVSEMIRRKAEIERLQRDIQTLKENKVRRRAAAAGAR